ncbi:tRNA 4-thiouridine(8) synthase ThiI [Candidatus Peregrinibacteria bacterium]|nr:tRNA 4-thiouridine(8) synthase ThiI [Candidatus Peregrinibacteria bacterium]
MNRAIIIHYGEIGLKKANVDYFLKKLRRHVKTKLEKAFSRTFDLKHTLGRFLIDLDDGFSLEDEEKAGNILGKIFGIKNYMFVFGGSLDIKELGEQIWSRLPNLNDVETFRVKCKRSQVLPYKSVDAERQVGAELLERGIDKKVKMKEPDLIVNIEFFNNFAWFTFKKHPGQAGLSANSGGKLVCIMSSGIDSPVAAYKMMKRGARVIFVNFHAYPITDKSEMDQCKNLVEVLSDYQFDTKLYQVPFGDFQLAIKGVKTIPDKIRTVLYRRMMLRVAEKISKKEEAKGVITGDNYGQVASQTAENMFVIHEASNIPLFQPLIAYDKEEIIEVAQRIGTFEISKLSCEDSCSVFMPKHPELKANVFDTIRFEEELDVEEWSEKLLKGAETIFF